MGSRNATGNHVDGVTRDGYGTQLNVQDLPWHHGSGRLIKPCTGPRSG
jgi:hypothetical protein